MDQNMESIITMLVNLSSRLENIETAICAMKEEIALLGGSKQSMHEKGLEEGTNISIRQMEKSSTAVTFEWSGSEDGISGTEDIHRECIQENLPEMSHCMDLKRVLLLDELIKNGCLTDNEAADIRECEKRKDQTRKLAVIMGKRSRVKFSSFLEVLKRTENYPFIAEKMENSYQTKIEEGRRKQECVPCYIIRNVNIRHIIDTLCSEFVVSLEFLGEVISCKANDKEEMQRYWKRLFEQMNTSVNARRNRKVFKESLKTKYEHIASKISVKNQIKCRCKAIEANINIRVESMSWPSGSGTTTTAALPTSHLSALSTFSTISESVSDISNNGINVNNSRTSEWLKNLPVEPIEIEFTNSQEALSAYSEIFNTECGVGDTQCSLVLQDKNSSLVAIGDDLLMEAGRNASMREKNNQPLAICDVSSKNSGNNDEKHLHPTQTQTWVKQTKSSKKRKKKRNRTQSEPSSNLPHDKLSLRQSLSQESTKNERTIGERLFDNIPTNEGVKDCSSNSLPIFSDQVTEQSPQVLTPSRQITPHGKVGCCDKGNNDKCRKKKKK